MVIGQIRLCLSLMAGTVGRGRVARLFALQILVAVSEGAVLVLLVPVIQALGGQDSLGIPRLSVHLSVPTAFALVIGVVVLRGLGQWRAAVLAVNIQLTTVDSLRLRLIDDLYAADWAFLSSQRRSHVVQRLTTDVERVNTALAMVLRLVVAGAILAATAVVAILISPLVGALATVALIVVAWFAARSVGHAVEIGRTLTDRLAGFGAALSDSLSSIRVMRAHDASGAWSQIVGAEASRLRGVRRSFVNRSAAINAVFNVVVVCAVLAMILVGRAAGMSLPQMATLAVVAVRLLSSAQNLLSSAQLFANDAGAVERLLGFEAEARAHPEPGAGLAGAERVTAGPGPLVSLRGVSVRYAGESSLALDGIDLDVPRRGVVVIAGPSGAGKSTLLDVVLGLLRPETGALLVDGRPVTDLAAWRRRIGYVPQQTVLVPGTVWDNLVWSVQPGVVPTEDDVWEVLRVSGLDEVVRSLPGGLQAPLQELAELSGGEQQRLCIARALLRFPELLVLDEATSALDSETEAQILDELLDGSRAVVMVTHRSVSDRDPVVVRVEGGRLVAGDSWVGAEG